MSEEPKLERVNSKPNIAWVKWYREKTGCGLRYAYDECWRRIYNGG